VTPDELNRRMERAQWDFFWVDDRAHVIDRDEIAYTWSPENRPHLNSVYRTRGAGAAALVSEVTRAHEGRTSRWLVYDTPGAPPDLEAVLCARGYELEQSHMTCVIDTRATLPPPSCEVRLVRTPSELDDALAILERAFELGSPSSKQERSRLLAACTGRGSRVSRFVAYVDGEPASTGALNVYPELRLAYLWGGGTVPSLRGRGAYTAITSARLANARLRGIEMAGVYARSSSNAARVLRLGFEQVGSMRAYHRRPSLRALVQ
jgi:hypothetical protein